MIELRGGWKGGGAGRKRGDGQRENCDELSDSILFNIGAGVCLWN